MLILGAVGIYATPNDSAYTPAAKLALRLDGLLDQVEEPKMEITQESLLAWTIEVLPFYEYEGVTASATVPDSVTLTPYLGAMEHFHILGQAQCGPFGGGPVYVNARVANPVSAWYGRPSTLVTLVHELGHIQGGGLCQGSSAELESTTQLVALEVLAAMANGGNKLALYALLDELRDMSLAAAHYEALDSGKLDAYRKLEQRVYSTPAERARGAKSARRWTSDPATLKDILYKYSEIPVDKILDGLDEQEIPNLSLVALPDYYGFVRFENPRRPLAIDDLAYVLAHADELLDGLPPTPQ